MIGACLIHRLLAGFRALAGLTGSNLVHIIVRAFLYVG